MNVKICQGPKRGGSPQSLIRYALGYIAGSHAKEHEKTERRHDDFHRLLSESVERSDFGIGTIWSPSEGMNGRPSSVFASGMTSLVTADLEMGISIAASRAHLVKDRGLMHIVTSWDTDESRWMSDAQAINMTRALLEHNEIGLGKHRFIITVHRDTMVRDQQGTLIAGTLHTHTVCESINPDTMRPWSRLKDWYRMHYAARAIETAFSTPEHTMHHDRGLYVVRQADGVERIDLATNEELKLWRREAVSAMQAKNARKYLADHLYHDNPRAWANAVVVPELRRYMQEAQDRKESFRWVEMHRIVEQAGGRLERDADGNLVVRYVERVEGEGESKDLTRKQGEQRWGKPADAESHDPGDWGEPTLARDERQRMMDAPPQVISAEDIAWEPPISACAEEKRAYGARVRWLTETFADRPQSTEAFILEVMTHPSLVSRKIVAGGDAIISRNDIDRFLSPRVPDAETIAQLGDFIEAHDLTLKPLTTEVPNPAYTTVAQHALGKRVLEKAALLAREPDPLFNRKLLDQAIADIEAEKRIETGNEDWAVSDEQRKALSGLDRRLSIIQGESGSGKTTVMRIVNRYCQLCNRPVVGLATTQHASEKLFRESGVFSLNSTRALMREKIGQQVIEMHNVTIVDEGRMVPLRHADKLIDLVKERDTAAIIIGDLAQVQSLEAGDTFKLLVEATKGQRCSELTKVYRQRNSLAWQQATTAEMGRGIREYDPQAIEHAVKVMDEHKVFEFYDTEREALNASAQAYVAARHEHGENAVINVKSVFHARYLNQEIRESLGLVGGTAIQTAKYGNADFSPGDRIIFTKNDPRNLCVFNGDMATISTIDYNRDSDAWQITAKLDDGREVKWDATGKNRYAEFAHGYAWTTFKIAGESVPVGYYVILSRDDAFGFHVGTTRGELAMKVFVAKTAGYENREDLARGIIERMEPKVDAVLYKELEDRYGGRDSLWAKNMRYSLKDQTSPLRREYVQYIRALTDTREDALSTIAAKHQAKMKPGLSDEGRKKIEFKWRAEATKAVKETEPESFIRWASKPGRVRSIMKQEAKIEQATQATKIRHERQEREIKRKPMTRRQRLVQEVDRLHGIDSQSRYREQQQTRAREHEGESYAR